MCRYAIEENKLEKLDAVNSVHELTGVVKLFFRFLNVLSQCSGDLYTLSYQGAARAAPTLERHCID